MKLGEALTERARLQQRVNTLRERLSANAFTQEGTPPEVDPSTIMGEMDETVDALEALIVKINRTNSDYRLGSGETIMEALAHRDMLGTRRATVQSVIGSRPEADRYYRMRATELRTVANVDLAALYEQADQLAETRRSLDAQIQAANWAADLVE